MKNLGRRALLVALLGVAIYGALVLLRGFESVSREFASYEAWTFAAACGLASSNYLLRFLRWEYYLAKLGIRGIPKGESLLTFLAGFVLTVTPGKVGEVFKSLILHETRGIAATRTAPIVVAERVTDLIGVIALIAIGSVSFPGGGWWAAMGAALVVALLIFVSSDRLSGAVIGWLPRLPGPLGALGGRVAPKVSEALGELRVLTTPARLVWPTALSMVAWALEGIGLWLILTGFGERPLPTLTAFFYATATLAGAIIPVPGGLGVTEKVMEEGMAGLGGVPAAVATSAMLLIRLATLWYAVAVGFVALAALRWRYPSLLSAASGATAVVDPSADRPAATAGSSPGSGPASPSTKDPLR